MGDTIKKILITILIGAIVLIVLVFIIGLLAAFGIRLIPLIALYFIDFTLSLFPLIVTFSIIISIIRPRFIKA